MDDNTKKAREINLHHRFGLGHVPTNKWRHGNNNDV